MTHPDGDDASGWRKNRPGAGVETSPETKLFGGRFPANSGDNQFPPPGIRNITLVMLRQQCEGKWCLEVLGPF
jgi:hypothetical protein